MNSAPSWADFVAGLELFVDPILCGAAAGLVLGLVGVYIVLRKMVFMPLAVTHASGLGVALTFYAQAKLGVTISPVVGSFVFGIGVTLLLMLNPKRLRLSQDSVLGVVYILAAGGAVLFGSQISQESHEIGNIIFGSAVAVDPADLHATLAVGAGVLAAHLWLRRGFICVSFDPDGAQVQRLPIRFLDATLLLSIGLLISVTTRALGALPVFAFCVLPALAALSLVRRLTLAFAFAAFFGVVAAVLGYVAAFFLQLPVGASQAVVATVIALLAFIVGKLLR